MSHKVYQPSISLNEYLDILDYHNRILILRSQSLLEKYHLYDYVSQTAFCIPKYILYHHLYKRDDAVEPVKSEPKQVKSVNNKPDSEPKNLKLNCSWTIWQITRSRKSHKKKKNDSFPVKIATFSSVDEFWFIFSRIKLPSSLFAKADLMVFRTGIDPIWEDLANVSGGSWKVILDNNSCKSNGINRTYIDRIWLETILLAIGEQFYRVDHLDVTRNISNKINGIYLQRRQKEDRLGLWTNEGSDSVVLKSIGATFKKILNVTDGTLINFSKHQNKKDDRGKSLRYREVVKFVV